MATFLRRAHDIDVTDRFKRIITAAVSNFDNHILNRLVAVLGLTKSVAPSLRARSNLFSLMSITMIRLALAILGIIHLPDYYVHVHLEAGRLVPILDPFRAPDNGIWAIYPHNRHLSPRVRLLLRHLGQGLG